jgi:hypothetical protein
VEITLKILHRHDKTDELARKYRVDHITLPMSFLYCAINHIPGEWMQFICKFEYAIHVQVEITFKILHRDGKTDELASKYRVDRITLPMSYLYSAIGEFIHVQVEITLKILHRDGKTDELARKASSKWIRALYCPRTDCFPLDASL